jgi:glutamate-1-semialdehyde 2,1-aminomutase
LSWVGSGRLIFSLNYRDEDLQAVLNRFVAAARQMEADGWWWLDSAMTNRSIRREILGEVLERWRGGGAFNDAGYASSDR